jgi:hypothetical protein
MDSVALDSNVMAVCLGLFLVVCVLCVLLLQLKRYIVLFLWPIIIYFCGPLITSIFSDAPVLRNYFFADAILTETSIIFAYFVFFVVIDYFLDISSAVRSCFNGPAIAGLAQSTVFLLIYFAATIVATILQMVMLAQLGSVFSGAYVGSRFEEIPFWGFLAGLYEIIFLCFVLFLLSGQKSKLRIFIIALYVMTAALRVAGGTRLILIKEVAVICILLYLRGQIKRSRLVLVASIILVLGSVVGFFRAHGELVSDVFGPLYGVAMESGLDALSFNVAYQVQETGYVADHAELLKTVEFVALSAIPSFLRIGVTQSDLDQMSPYGEAHAQFDTESPVGGMSGFATICYMSSYPLLSTLTLVLILSLLVKLTRQGSMKEILVVVMSINAIHFWRDPIDIAVKNVVQDVVCALTLLYLPAAYRAVISAWSRSAAQPSERSA